MNLKIVANRKGCITHHFYLISLMVRGTHLASKADFVPVFSSVGVIIF